MNIAPGSEDGECALCCLGSLLSSHYLSDNSSQSLSSHYAPQPLHPSLRNRCYLPSYLVCKLPCIADGPSWGSVTTVGGQFNALTEVQPVVVGSATSVHRVSFLAFLRMLAFNQSLFHLSILLRAEVSMADLQDGVTDIIPSPFSAAGWAVFKGVAEAHTQVWDCCFGGFVARLTSLL